MNDRHDVTNTTATSRSLADVVAGLQIPLEEAMLTQRAIRRLLRDPVDDDIVLRCIELALKAPTGSNGQNWEFVVVKDRSIKERLARLNRQAVAVYGGIGKRVNRGNEAMEKILAAVDWQADHFEEIPVLVVACLRGNHVPFVPLPPMAQSSYYGSIYPSVQNLLLAARAMGLGAALITLPRLPARHAVPRQTRGSQASSRSEKRRPQHSDQAAPHDRDVRSRRRGGVLDQRRRPRRDRRIQDGGRWLPRDRHVASGFSRSSCFSQAAARPFSGSTTTRPSPPVSRSPC